MISLGLHDITEPLSGSDPDSAATRAEHTPAKLQALKERLSPLLGPRFEVLEPIAIGGMATLFQLRHTLHGGLLVAKVLHVELAHRPEVVDSFRREARHAAQIGGHPNAVPVFDSSEVADLLFILMPFVEGHDLDRLLTQNGPLLRAEALRFAAQMSNLLCYLESQGITHCDLAPGNIRLDRFGRYRVLDFGLSHAKGAASYRPLGGTPLYSSPEQVRGEVPDLRSDIYSLGVVLCEALTGRPLLQANSLQDIRGQHLQGSWTLPSEIEADKPLAALLRRMLAADRDKRLGTAQELSSALVELRADSSEADIKLTSEVTERTPVSRPIRRPRLSE